jgi:hypothetical protein
VLVKNKKGKLEERAPEVNFDEKIQVGKNSQVISVRLVSTRAHVGAKMKPAILYLCSTASTLL